MAQERLTKDQKRDYAREMARLEREKRLKSQARNRILVRVGATVAVLAVLAGVAGGIWLATRPAGPGPANMASDGILLTGSDGAISAVATPAIASGEEPVPTDPDAYDVPLKIVTYIDYGCPYCGLFETTNGATIRSLVESGEATLEVHPIAILDRAFLEPYPTRAANAAACVAAFAPDQFLDVNDAFFANQPAEQSAGLTISEIQDLVAGAGVDSADVRACISDLRFQDWTKLATDRATDGPLPNTEVENVSGTPTVLVNGIKYQPNDLGSADEFTSFLQQILLASLEEDGATPTPTPTPTP